MRYSSFICFSSSSVMSVLCPVKRLATSGVTNYCGCDCLRRSDFTYSATICSMSGVKPFMSLLIAARRSIVVIVSLSLNGLYALLTQSFAVYCPGTRVFFFPRAFVSPAGEKICLVSVCQRTLFIFASRFFRSRLTARNLSKSI